nr:MAG TPA: hypothetical protein [Caudoviricetes sp.]
MKDILLIITLIGILICGATVYGTIVALAVSIVLVKSLLVAIIVGALGMMIGLFILGVIINSIFI